MIDPLAIEKPNGQRKLDRLRMTVLVLMTLILGAAISMPVVVSVLLARQRAQTQLAVSCTVLKANVVEMQATQRNGVILEEIAQSLGLAIVPPPAIDIPEVPPECRES